VITGVFESIDREETKSLILKHGGKVTNYVTRMTKYLVAGRDCGQSKLDKVRHALFTDGYLIFLVFYIAVSDAAYQQCCFSRR